MRHVPIWLLSAALVAGAQFAVAADPPPKIYECKDAAGETIYQDDPCLDPSRMAPPLPAPAAAKMAGKPAAKPPAKSKTSAKPKPEIAAGKKLAPILPSHPAAASLPWVAVLPSAPPLPVGSLGGVSSDVRWSSPQRALQTFVGAVKVGDRDLVLSCLTSSALADLGPNAASVPIDDLRTTVGSFTGYVVEGDLGPYWSIRALRAGTRPKWIFFERTGNGEWKIGAI